MSDAKVVVALDFDKKGDALSFVDKVSPNDCRLKVGKEMFTYFEEQIRNKKIKDAEEIAKIMNAEDKQAFFMNVWSSLPSGAELTNQVTEIMCSVDGVGDVIYMSARDFDPSINLEDIRGLINSNELDELTVIVKWIYGREDAEIAENLEDVEEDAEKKTLKV